MDLIMDFVSEVILSLLGATITFLAAKLGKFLGDWYREKLTDETLRSVAKTCVLAVEQMYQNCLGSEKLERALTMGEEMLRKKGIKIEKEELRVILEAALTEMKGAVGKV